MAICQMCPTKVCWAACVVIGIGLIITAYALLGQYDDAAMVGDEEAFHAQENLSLGFMGTAAMIGGSIIIALPMIFGGTTSGVKCSGALLVLAFSTLAICWLLIPHGDFLGAMDFGDLENYLSKKQMKYSGILSDCENTLFGTTNGPLDIQDDEVDPPLDDDDVVDPSLDPDLQPDPDPPPDPPPESEPSLTAPPGDKPNLTPGSGENVSLVGHADTRTRRLGEHEPLPQIQLASQCVLGISGLMLVMIFYALFKVHLATRPNYYGQST